MAEDARLAALLQQVSRPPSVSDPTASHHQLTTCSFSFQRTLTQRRTLSTLLAQSEPGGAAAAMPGLRARLDDDLDEAIDPAGARFGGGVGRSGAADDPASRRARAAAMAQQSLDARLAGASAMERRMLEQMERDRERYERMAREARAAPPASGHPLSPCLDTVRRYPSAPLAPTSVLLVMRFLKVR